MAEPNKCVSKFQELKKPHLDDRLRKGCVHTLFY